MIKKKQISKFQFLNKLTKKSKKQLITLCLAVVIIAVLYLSRSLFIAAMVNGRPISRLSILKALEVQGGKQVLDGLIDQALINQEIANLKVTVSQEEVDEEFRRIEELLKAQNLTLDAALDMQGQTREDLTKEIKKQKAIEDILSDKITVSEEEMTKYHEENKNFFEPGKTYDELKDQIRQSVQQEKLSVEYEKWVGELREKAKIHRFVSF